MADKNKVVLTTRQALDYTRYLLQRYHIGNLSEMQLVEELDAILIPTKNEDWREEWEKDSGGRFLEVDQHCDFFITE